MSPTLLAAAPARGSAGPAKVKSVAFVTNCFTRRFYILGPPRPARGREGCRKFEWKAASLLQPLIKETPMKIGIVISTEDPETCWNAFRLGSFALKQGDEVKVFLIGRGVEYEKTSTAKFDAAAQARELLRAGGKILACGTCIKSRAQTESDICPISTMRDLYEIVKESEKVLTF
jgi:uncharacterized protein involved in oxidation of intracellular sulfur